MGAPRGRSRRKNQAERMAAYAAEKDPDGRRYIDLCWEIADNPLNTPKDRRDAAAAATERAAGKAPVTVETDTTVTLVSEDDAYRLPTDRLERLLAETRDALAALDRGVAGALGVGDDESADVVEDVHGSRG